MEQLAVDRREIKQFEQITLVSPASAGAAKANKSPRPTRPGHVTANFFMSIVISPLWCVLEPTVSLKSPADNAKRVTLAPSMAPPLGRTAQVYLRVSN